MGSTDGSPLRTHESWPTEADSSNDPFGWRFGGSTWARDRARGPGYPCRLELPGKRITLRLTEAAATANGRDHWTRVYSALWAGGGVRGGLVYGASDKNAAEPARLPVAPARLAASLFHALGVNPHQELHDRVGKPHALAVGDPILDLFA